MKKEVKEIFVITIILMLVIVSLSGCGEEEDITPPVEEPTEPLDSDGDGIPDEFDAFPYDPELSRLSLIINETITLQPGAAKTFEFTTEDDDKYAVVYWEVNPFTDEAGNTIAFRFKTQEGWKVTKHTGKTRQVMEGVNENNYGNWSIWIKHDTIVTGYALQIEVNYRLFILG